MVDTPARKRVVRFTKREARRMFDAGAERVEFDPKTGRLTAMSIIRSIQDASDPVRIGT